MAIRHLLWACPYCGTEDGLREGSRGEACTACGTRYRRGRGACIVAEPPGAEPRERTAAEWLAQLSGPRLPEHGRARRDHAEVRFAHGDAPVRRRGTLLGFVAQFGAVRTGTLVLTPDTLRFEGDNGAERHWPLDALTAVQANSTTLHVKARHEPVVAARLPNGSVRLWVKLLEATLQRLYTAAGRGEIVEFQPHIVTR